MLLSISLLKKQTHESFISPMCTYVQYFSGQLLEKLIIINKINYNNKKYETSNFSSGTILLFHFDSKHDFRIISVVRVGILVA